MKFTDRLKFATNIMQGKVPANTIIKKIGHNYPEVPDPKLSDVVEYFKRNLTFKLAVLTYAYRSSGMGSYHTVRDPNSSEGKKALELIDSFAEDWDLDNIDFKIARDGWMGGNAFLNLVSAEKISGLYMLPMSSFTKIERDESGNPVKYIQQWGGRAKTIDTPEIILHFRYNPVDEDAFGEGIGQAMARPGKGYETEAGNVRKSISIFEMQERMNDDISLLLHSGLPRYLITFPGAEDDFLTDAQSRFETLDTLEHLVVNAEGKVERIALDTQGKFDSFIRHVSDQVTTGTMSPLIRLWSSMDFTFASSKEATDAMDPSVQHFQRMHKRFDERGIYWPVLTQNGIDPKVVKLRKNWGIDEKPKLEMDHIMKLLEMKAAGGLPTVKDEDLVNMLVEAGAKIVQQKPEMEPIVKDVNKELNSFKRFSELWS